MKIAILSLGCPKNQVDADRFCRALIEAGHVTVANIASADAVIINTCGFIQSAKEEAIDAIFDACALKKQTPSLKVIVCGCLSERYRSQLAEQIPELDAVVGIGANAELPSILQKMQEKQSEEVPLEFYDDKQKLPLDTPRVVSTPSHYAYLKISEGCSNSCAYCAIPSIRGPLRSREMQSVVKEARWLAEQGVKELVLVAQDVTAYGDDTGNNMLIPLLSDLESIEGIRWIRLLYTYPHRISRPLLEMVAQSEKVLPYFDIPIQHCNEEILRSMGRKGGAEAVTTALSLIRGHLPNAVLRTSLIVGYPGETQEQFEQLCEFVRDMRFDRLGCFAYSAEEGTPAAEMPNQIPQEQKEERVDIIMRMQAQIMAEKQQQNVGKTVCVLCDGPDETGDYWQCRAASDAPEIDANVLVDISAPMVCGEFYDVCITQADGYDLIAKYEL